jgi:tetratricopeptide (TPR) repeat protein
MAGHARDVFELVYALRLLELVLPRIDEQTQQAEVTQQIGLVQRDLGRFAPALASLQRALTINEAVYGLEHPEVARTLTNLGIVQWQLGEFEASRVTLQRALAIFEAVYGLEMGNSSEVVQRDYSHLFRARAVPKGAFRDPRSNDAARRGFGADARDRGDCSTLAALEFARGERIDPEAVIAEARADATSC